MLDLASCLRPRDLTTSFSGPRKPRARKMSWAAKTALVASAAAFLLSESADFAVYTPLQRRGLVLAVAASSLAGLAVDSVVFLTLAFGNLEFLAGQVVGKTWAVLLSLPLIRWVRRVAPTPA